MGKADILEDEDIEEIYVEVRGSGETYETVLEKLGELSIDYNESEDPSTYTTGVVMKVNPEKGLGGKFKGEEALDALNVLLE
ncbi:MAG: hypothetical protein H8Z69_05210 [Nanohaloarchaea archaeon]|nr:hypothetical protein [Candidatus Nanohaloarchaea archaeon]